MACGGYFCSKYALAFLNIIYMIVAIILISVAAYGKAAAILTSIAIIGGIIACGIFLLLIAIIGLIGALKHHQVLLFFYMIILFLLFLIQFAIACACLSLDEDQQKSLITAAWNSAKNETREDVEKQLNCCGFEDNSSTGCENKENCWIKIKNVINKATKISGGIGLFFSFTEIIGVWLAVRFRNLKDPRANPSAFL